MQKKKLWKNIRIQGAHNKKQQVKQYVNDSLLKPQRIKNDYLMDESMIEQNQNGIQLITIDNGQQQELRISPMLLTMNQIDHHDDKFNLNEYHQEVNSPTSNRDYNFLFSSRAPSRIKNDNLITKKQFFILTQKKFKNIIENIQRFKKQLENQKLYLLNLMAEWEILTMNETKKINDYTNSYIINLKQKCQKIANKNKQYLEIQINQIKTQRDYYENEYHRICKEIQIERNKSKKLSEQIRLNQSKRQTQQHSKNSEEIQEIQKRNRTNQSKISEFLIERQNSQIILSKLKEIVNDKQIIIQSKEQAIRQKCLIINQLKQKIVEFQTKQTSNVSLLNSYKNKQSVLIAENQKINKLHRQQINKLKSLLKESQLQLVNCEHFIEKKNNELKFSQYQKSILNDKIKESEIHFFKKLQHIDKSLIELQNYIDFYNLKFEEKEMQNSKMQQKNRQFQKKLEELYFQLMRKQSQMEEIKQEYQRKCFTLAERQKGLQAEYLMAIEQKNKTKQQWYQRYYELFSPQKQRQNFQRSQKFEQYILNKNRIAIPEKDQNRKRQNYVKNKSKHFKKPEISKLKRALSEKNFSAYPPLNNGMLNTNKEYSQLNSKINAFRFQINKELKMISSK